MHSVCFGLVTVHFHNTVVLKFKFQPIQSISDEEQFLLDDVDYEPTLSLGIKRSSAPCLRKTFPAVCCGLMPTPSSVMTADVAGFCLNSSAANFNTAVNGVCSGTLRTLKGSFGSDVRVILKVTFVAVAMLSLTQWPFQFDNSLWVERREREEIYVIRWKKKLPFIHETSGK